MARPLPDTVLFMSINNKKVPHSVIFRLLAGVTKLKRNTVIQSNQWNNMGVSIIYHSSCLLLLIRIHSNPLTYRTVFKEEPVNHDSVLEFVNLIIVVIHPVSDSK